MIRQSVRLGSMQRARSMRGRAVQGAALLLFGLSARLHFATARIDTYGDCSHLGDCNGHGECNTLTRTCDCFPGWGAESDVSAIKSPDCSKRAPPRQPSVKSMP